MGVDLFGGSSSESSAASPPQPASSLQPSGSQPYQGDGDALLEQAKTKFNEATEVDISVKKQHIAKAFRSVFIQAVQTGTITLYNDVTRLYNVYYKHLLDNPEYSKMPEEEQDLLSALFVPVNNEDIHSILPLLNTIVPVIELPWEEH